MCTWSHYSFRQRLLFKSREYRHCRVVVTSEAYTSKTCGACGVLHSKLGGSKTFKCPSCGVCLDRDANGARNILLRVLTRKEQELCTHQAACKRQRVQSTSSRKSDATFGLCHVGACPLEKV